MADGLMASAKRANKPKANDGAIICKFGEHQNKIECK
jgi:hypothetical protein